MTFLDLLFHGVLFGLLLHMIFLMVKNYLIPYLHAAVEIKKKQQMELIEREQLLLATQARVEGQIKTQKKLFVSLEKNVKEWHAFSHRAVAEHEQQERLIVQYLTEKQRKQSNYLHLIRNMRQSHDFFEHSLAQHLADHFEQAVLSEHDAPGQKGERAAALFLSLQFSRRGE